MYDQRLVSPRDSRRPARDQRLVTTTAAAPGWSPATRRGTPSGAAYLAFAAAGFRRYATYRQAMVAAVFTNSIFGFLRAAVLLAVAGAAAAVGYDAARLLTFVWAGQGLIGVVLLWAPTELADQDGQPLAFCPRGTLRRQQAAAEADGLEILAATEIEFVAFDATGKSVAGRGGPAYGLSPLLEHAAFVDDVHRDFDHAGLAIEQLHAEYGPGQIELSVAPAAPLQAADANVLARVLLCRAGRRHGLRLSFSPRPFAAGVGPENSPVDHSALLAADGIACGAVM